MRSSTAAVPWILVLVSGLSGCQGTRVLASATDGSSELPSLETVFTTANTISFSWDAGTLDSDVNGYLVRYATDRDDLAAGEGETWDVDDDPNLGWGVAPYGANRVEKTNISGLQPDTLYHAVLVAHHQDGRSSMVAEGQAATTAEPPDVFVIFDESLPPGTRQWFEDTLSDHARSGNSALVFNGDGAWTSARLMQMSLDIGPVASRPWDQAYLELYVDMDVLHDRPYPIYFIHLDVANQNGEEFGYAYATLPNRLGWQMIQVPLRAFLHGGDPMTPGSFGDVLDMFTFSMESPSYRNVYVDDIVIRY